MARVALPRRPEGVALQPILQTALDGLVEWKAFGEHVPCDATDQNVEAVGVRSRSVALLQPP